MAGLVNGLLTHSRGHYPSARRRPPIFMASGWPGKGHGTLLKKSALS
jgi:hypothetical protein